LTLGRDDVAKLRRARARVAGLAPRDLALRRARARLSGVLAELALVHAGERLRPRNARSAEGGAAAVVSQLGAFARQHPGIAAIAPD
jgi:hypothetical protein